MGKDLPEGAAAITLREFCSPEKLEQNNDNQYYQRFCKSSANLKDFPAPQDVFVEVQKPDSASTDKMLQLEAALNRTTLKLSTPDVRVMEKLFEESSASERAQIKAAFENKNHKSLLTVMGDKLGPASEKYHNLKGLLLRSDSENSMVAVQLHDALKKIEKTSHNIDKSGEGAAAGYIRKPGKSGGAIATIDLIDNLLSRGLRRSENKSLAEAINKMGDKDVVEMKSEHMRIYRRDIADMVENTPGLSQKARDLFRQKGIE